MATSIGISLPIRARAGGGVKQRKVTKKRLFKALRGYQAFEWRHYLAEEALVVVVHMRDFNPWIAGLTLFKEQPGGWTEQQINQDAYSRYFRSRRGLWRYLKRVIADPEAILLEEML